MTLTLVTALGPQLDATFVTQVERAPGVSVSRRCADLAELLSVGAAGVADIAAVSADLRGLDRDALGHLTGHGVTVVGVIEAGDEDAERRLRQLGVQLVITSAATAGEIGESLVAIGEGSTHRSFEVEELHPDPISPAPDVADVEPSRRGVVTAVWGPTGAPGRTTVAVTLAHHLAQLGSRVLLVDLDTWGAAVGQVLGLLDEAPGVAAAARLSDQGALDLPALARVSPEVAPRLRVLTGLSDATRWPELRAGAVEDLLGIGRLLADHVILDCGFSVEDDEELSYDTRAPRRNGATISALTAADHVLAVGAADPVSLQRLVRAVQSLEPLAPAPPHVVVTKVRASVAGSRPEKAITDVLGRFAGMGDLHFVPWDPDTCDAALARGRSLVEQAPQAPVTRAISALAAVIDASLTAPAGSGPTQTPLRRRRGARP